MNPVGMFIPGNR